MIARERDFHPHYGEVPHSKGVPLELIIAVLVGLLIIFGIGAGVILTSGHGHMWPSITTERMHLKGSLVHPRP
jgi:hypothetical protein